MLFFLPILELQAFALPFPHRIDNAVSPRQYAHLYHINNVYRNVPRKRLVVICLLWELDEFAKFVVHNDRRPKTSFSYIRPPAHPLVGYCKRWCKDTNNSDSDQII